LTALLALVAGFILGVKTDEEDFGEVRRALVALYGSDEFADVASAMRSQVAKTLRMAANMIDTEPVLDTSGDDVVNRVRHLIAHD
jgi:hypothetical protein